MKTPVLLLTGILTPLLLCAQPPPPPLPGNLSTMMENTNRFGLGSETITNGAGEVFPPEVVEYQLTELHRAIEQTLPMLSAVTETYSNSAAAKQPGMGGMAGVLGGVLNRTTNNSTATPRANGNTNSLGQIVRAALLAATTNSASSNLTDAQSLAALQEHLQAARPLLQRLGISTNRPVGLGSPQDDSTIGTGAGRGRPKNQ